MICFPCRLSQFCMTRCNRCPGFCKTSFCFLAVNPAFMGVSKPFPVQYGKHIGAMVTAIIPYEVQAAGQSDYSNLPFNQSTTGIYWVSTLSPQVDISESSSHTFVYWWLRKAGAAGEFFSSWGASPWPRKMSPSRRGKAPKTPGPVVWELGGSLNLQLIFHNHDEIIWNLKAVEWDSGNVWPWVLDLDRRP